VITPRRTCFGFIAWVCLLQAVLAPAGVRAADQQRVALVIGNADYPDATSPLAAALRSARAVADQLQKSGFEVDVFENLDNESLQTTVASFYEKIEPGAVVVFFFSGFAIQAARENFIIPLDALIWKESDVRRESLSIEAILAAFGKRGATTRVIVLDASRRNPFERRFRAYSAGLGIIETPKNSIIISAASPGKVIADSDQDNSLFVEQLLKQTNAPGVPVADVFNRAREDVSRATNGQQVPWVSINLPNRIYISKPPVPLLPRRPLRAQQKMAPE
jgi:uncharacterized caspase-like protein